MGVETKITDDRHDITEILLKVALITITLTLTLTHLLTIRKLYVHQRFDNLVIVDLR